MTTFAMVYDYAKWFCLLRLRSGIFKDIDGVKMLQLLIYFVTHLLTYYFV